jgi:hypothetical protein
MYSLKVARNPSRLWECTVFVLGGTPPSPKIFFSFFIAILPAWVLNPYTYGFGAQIGVQAFTPIYPAHADRCVCLHANLWVVCGPARQSASDVRQGGWRTVIIPPFSETYSSPLVQILCFGALES